MPLPLSYWFQFKKLRIFLAWFGGILLFLGSRMNGTSFKIGLPFLIAGELIRIGSLGFLERRGKKLTSGGPFAYVRHPLYIGNFFIGLGIVLLANQPWLLGIFLAGFFILYAGTVRKEEKDLSQKFGNDYLSYRKAVPSFVPRFTPYSAAGENSFQWNRLLQYRENITWAGQFLLLIALYLFQKVVRQRKFFAKEKLALAAGGVMILYLAGEWVFREWKKRSMSVRAASC